MKSSFWIAALLTAVFAAGFPILAQSPSARSQPEKMRQFIYIVRIVPRLHDEKAWTDQDKRAARNHFERLRLAGQHGPVIQAGRTEEPADKTLEIVIFEAPDETAARAFMENDPAVKAGIMTAELHPYLVAVQRGANQER